MTAQPWRLSDEVAIALDTGRPVVALESTIITHGLPAPMNLDVARSVEAIIRDEGATPATIAIIEGVVHIGLSADQLSRLASSDDVLKASIRDLGTALLAHRSASTTVAATSHLATLAGIEVFATGGLGGVHRGAQETWDESADLFALATHSLTVVCSGIKSILDVPATMERLETFGIAAIGYRTDRLPGFYLTDAGFPLDARVESPAEIAALMKLRRGLRDPAALVVFNPLPVDQQVPVDVHDELLRSGLARAQEAGITGKDVTPFLLDHFHTQSAGVSLAANQLIIEQNARLAARIAVAARSAADDGPSR